MRAARDSIPVGSYNPSEFVAPTVSEFTDDALSPNWTARRSNSGKFASSLPAGGFDMSSLKQNNFPASSLTTVSIVNMPPGGEQGPSILPPGKEQSGEDASCAGAGGDVEEVSNAGIWVSGFAAEGGLQVCQRLGSKNAVGGATSINGEDSDFAAAAWEVLGAEGRSSSSSGSSSRRSSINFGEVGNELGIVVPKKELVFEDGEEFTSEFVHVHVALQLMKH